MTEELPQGSMLLFWFREKGRDHIYIYKYYIYIYIYII